MVLATITQNIWSTTTYGWYMGFGWTAYKCALNHRDEYASNAYTFVFPHSACENVHTYFRPFSWCHFNQCCWIPELMGVNALISVAPSSMQSIPKYCFVWVLAVQTIASSTMITTSLGSLLINCANVATHKHQLTFLALRIITTVYTAMECYRFRKPVWILQRVFPLNSHTHTRRRQKIIGRGMTMKPFIVKFA